MCSGYFFPDVHRTPLAGEFWGTGKRLWYKQLELGKKSLTPTGLKSFINQILPIQLSVSFPRLPGWTFALSFALTMQNITWVRSTITPPGGTSPAVTHMLSEAVTSFFFFFPLIYILAVLSQTIELHCLLAQHEAFPHSSGREASGLSWLCLSYCSASDQHRQNPR